MWAGTASVATANPLTFLCSPWRSPDCRHLPSPQPSLRRHPCAGAARRRGLPRGPCPAALESLHARAPSHATQAHCAEMLRKEWGGWSGLGGEPQALAAQHSLSSRLDRPGLRDSSVQTQPCSCQHGALPPLWSMATGARHTAPRTSVGGQDPEGQSLCLWVGFYWERTSYQ